MTTHWQDDFYDDDEWMDYDSDDDLFPYEDDYETVLWWQKIINFPAWIRWHIVEFWNYKLGMRRCPICGRFRWQKCSDDCIPF